MQISNVQVSIDMRRFGYNFSAPTHIELVNEMLHSFDTEHDEYFCDGAGKQAMLADMDIFVSCEYDYFAEDTLRQIEEPERWRAFLTACVA
jgi:hypothetical protein